MKSRTVITLVAAGFMSIACGRACSEAENVAHEEFGARATVRKYEWFKDAAAQLQKKEADIQVYSARLKSMEADYEGTKRKDWDRTDKENMNQWQTELAGVRASYNGLAADYNSNMSKMNWRYANVGEVPAGAEALPREFRTYNIGE